MLWMQPSCFSKLWTSALGALGLLLWLPVEAGNLAPSKHLTSTQVMYYNRGELDARHSYKYELIRQALEVSRPEFGDYQIIPYAMEPSPKRQSHLLSEGKKINILWGSPGTPLASGDAIEIPIDILNGLLGYRVCLTNGSSELWPQMRTPEDLQQLRIGQGLNWGDIGVYKYNGINPLQSTNFEGLFDMLGAKRFDCLPLGADEALFTYRRHKADFPQLQIDSHYLIHYEYPLYFYVSKSAPLLAERIQLGLQKLQKSGAFNKLFKYYLAADLRELNLAQRKLICLKSPYMPAEQQSCDLKPLLQLVGK